uniref:Uncharacterized protein n=1 Tax=uncultured marine microorganism HF4000_APKG10F13 TaxID=455557 RepID=B3TBT0_9ZZZZ|nr:hypothetical protein ALOHA_HF4000APKG10F13ctg1g23 [uncultured marine microorganism HF4000_APKG10F13]
MQEPVKTLSGSAAENATQEPFRSLRLDVGQHPDAGVPGRLEIGINFQRLVERLQRARQVTLRFPEHGAAVVPGVYNVGVHLQRAVKRLQRLLRAAEPVEQHAAVAVERVVLRVRRDGVVAHLQRLIQLSPLHQQHHQVGVRLLEVGLHRNRLLVALTGVIEFLQQLQRLPLVVPRLGVLGVDAQQRVPALVRLPVLPQLSQQHSERLPGLRILWRPLGRHLVGLDCLFVVAEDLEHVTLALQRFGIFRLRQEYRFEGGAGTIDVALHELHLPQLYLDRHVLGVVAQPALEQVGRPFKVAVIEQPGESLAPVGFSHGSHRGESEDAGIFAHHFLLDAIRVLHDSLQHPRQAARCEAAGVCNSDYIHLEQALYFADHLFGVCLEDEQQSQPCFGPGPIEQCVYLPSIFIVVGCEVHTDRLATTEKCPGSLSLAEPICQFFPKRLQETAGKNQDVRCLEADVGVVEVSHQAAFRLTRSRRPAVKRCSGTRR